MRASFARLHADGYFGGPGDLPAVVPIARMFLPAIERASYAPVNLQREIAALQTIEALRMAVATPGGAFPESLDELHASPAPIDPATGQPIDCQIRDGVVTLTLPPPEGLPANQFGKRYELSLNQQPGN
jgi:hypothetical protein